MSDPLEMIAEILIKYYPPIGNIEHKYRTKVTAIGLLKSAKMAAPEFLMPFYERLMSYKLLVKNLIDNFKLSFNSSMKIFSNIINRIIHDDSVNAEERFKSKYVIWLMILLNPDFKQTDKQIIYDYSKKFLTNMAKVYAIQRVAFHIAKKYLSEHEQANSIAQIIVKKCLTGIKQEEVINRLSSAIYNYFVYGYYDKAKKKMRYELAHTYKGLTERHEPFYNIKVLIRYICSKAEDYVTTVNIFGPRITNYDEIKNLFKRSRNITVMFF